MNCNIETNASDNLELVIGGSPARKYELVCDNKLRAIDIVMDESLVSALIALDLKVVSEGGLFTLDIRSLPREWRNRVLMQFWNDNQSAMDSVEIRKILQRINNA